MSNNRGTRSISRKINTRSVSKMFWTFLLLDIMVIVITGSLWIVFAEYSLNSDMNDLADNSTRHFTSITEAEKDAHNIVKTGAYKDYKSAESLNSYISIPWKNFKSILTESFYTFTDKNGNIHYAYSGTFLLMLTAVIFTIIVFELVILLFSTIFGARKIRKDLAPLDELAFKADMLARASSFDQQALDELEEAINRLSPSGDGASLHTNNAELTELEHAINGLLERTRETYRQQSRFVSDASHELRTPISVLQGYVNMLDRWGKNDEQILDESIEAIKSETDHMKKLVEQLLFLARGDSGKTKLSIEPFSLNDMMQEVYNESVMIDKDHKYKFIPHSHDIIISGDPAMLKQTARILIDNATKYAPADTQITIKTTFAASESSAIYKHPAFVIQDEGIGMSGIDAAHIFERFYRSDPARTKDSGGTGLGLSIAKWIVDRHGGYFDVLSREDIGTRITVFLPQKQQ